MRGFSSSVIFAIRSCILSPGFSKDALECTLCECTENQALGVRGYVLHELRDRYLNLLEIVACRFLSGTVSDGTHHVYGLCDVSTWFLNILMS